MINVEQTICFTGHRPDRLGGYAPNPTQFWVKEALKAAILYTFESTNIHKINANYMPSNKASGKVLKKLGFEEIGLAKKELFLGGKWCDHIETRLINKNWRCSPI